MNMIGKEILNYRIISEIGRGAMGVVYLAEHKNINTQKAAVKVINADMANGFTRKMLKDEAEHLAGLHHHNIVSFLDFHIDKEGNIYLIMEYAEGESLESYIKNVSGLIVEDRICPLFEPILDGVGYAHKKGILHRDIKPANIVIATDGTPKILDFGIAKIINKNANDEPDSLVMGTPAYMSPEQVKGEGLDERSDIYSLGVLLHQMLTGNAPYDTTTLTEQDINKKVVEEPLPRMRTYYKYVSDKVQAVVDKATAKKPGDRYQNCEEFKNALHKAIYPWKPKAWMKLAGAAVIALFIGSGFYAWDYNRTKVKYFKDYVEVWGVPQGVGKLSSGEHGHSHRSYKFVYKKRKLLRVSHVNSLDNLIEDGESERNERPIDQEFHYTDNGKVSRVVVKDRSGKVLYVKSYNDKLNTMAFQYNDEHGTERTVSNKTVGYGRLLEQNADDRGRISRWWIEYDESGYAMSIKYAGLDNSPVCDENGIYGRRFVRDKKGRATEIHYIGHDGEPQPTKWGLGIKKFFYDDDDNWVKAEYLTIDEQPAFDDNDGVSVYVMSYDEYGNLEYAFHQSPDGSLMYPKKHNIAGVHSIYDNKGLEIRTEYLGTDKTPVFVSGQGYSIVESEYDNNGYVSKTVFLDPEGNPIESSEGNASRTFVNDGHGNVLETWMYSLDNELCSGSNGSAGVKFEYDSVGNRTSVVYYGKNQMPCETSNGSSGEAYEFNDKNLVTRVTYLDKNLSPVRNINNIAVIVFEYDKRGNTTKVSFYDMDGLTPVYNNEGTAGWNDIYDDMGNHVERNFFDKEGKAHMPSGLHYAKILYIYDDKGNLKSFKYYNLQGQLTSVNGIAGREYILDSRGNILEDKPIGINSELAYGKVLRRYKYDKFDNVIEMSVFDKNGATLNAENVHKYEYVYNSRNQQIEERRYGKTGGLIMCDYNWAIRKDDIDERGNLRTRRYFGTDGKPCMTRYDGGWSSATYEYDAYGHIIRQSYFNADGNPTDPKLMAPVGVAEYDKWGNMTMIAAKDSKDNYILYPGEKWSIRRFEFDRRSNIISVSYYDAKNNPVLCSDGYHKQTHKYNLHDNKIEDAYFGTNGHPILVNGFHKETYKYAENSNNVVEDAVFDTKGNPVNANFGFHKIVTTYNEEGTLALTRKYYRANGTLLATERWNGYAWEMTQQQFDWREHLTELNRECPLDFGADAMHLTMQHIRVTGNRDCEIRFIVPNHAKNQLSSEQMNALKQTVQQITKYVEEQLNHKPYVTGNLYDKNGTSLYSVRI